MALKCPYDKLSILIALGQVPEEIMTDENGEKLHNLFAGKFPKDLAEKKKLIASSNGITVMELINSPNYEKLVEEYEDEAITSIRTEVKTLFGFTDEQSWGIILTVTGQLNEDGIS